MKTNIRPVVSISNIIILSQLLLMIFLSQPAKSQQFSPSFDAKLLSYPLKSGNPSPIIESEPNNNFTEANILTIGDSAEIHGLINSAGDNDFFRFEITTAQGYLFRTAGTSFFTDVFPRLELYDETGNLLSLSEMLFPLPIMSQLAYEFSLPGIYYIKIENLEGTGGSDSLGYAYSLSIKPAILSDNLAITRLSSKRTQRPVYHVEKAGDFLFGLELDSLPQLKSWNVSDPENPIILDSLPFFGLPNSIAISGNYAYIPLQFGVNGIAVVDISNPAALSSPTQLIGFDARSSFVDNTGLYITDDEGGLRQYDISQPAVPVLQNRIQLPDSVMLGLTANESHLFIGTNNRNLIILDKQTFNIQSTLPFNDIVSSCMLREDILFVSGVQSLSSIDISNPEAPQVISTFSTDINNLFVYNSFLSDDYIYLANMFGGIRKIDITDPDNLIESGFYYSLTDFTALDMVVENGVVYAASGEFYNFNGGDPRNGIHILQNDLVSGFDDNKPRQVSSTFELHSNYPNPFNPSTTITYSLQKPSNVRMAIYNSLGQEVTVLVNEKQSAGIKSVKWNGLDKNNRPSSTGVYLYRLQTDDGIQTRRMMLIK
ncbi:MAG: T9SS type A sorting domain-containing protein [Calditrichia bacterium]